MTITDWIQAISMVVLVIVTIVYARRTHVISKATEKQAKASVEMAEEMKEQREINTRPVIVQKAVHEKDILEGSTKDYFSHFEISNVGNSPAIEVEISLMGKDRSRTYSIRQTFLRSDDPPIKFHPYGIADLEEAIPYHLICEYQNIFSRGTQKTLYQTLLPFKIAESSKEGKIYMIAGELEFHEISEKERIDAFISRSKPK